MSIVKFATTQTGVKWDKHSKSFEAIPGLFTYEAERRKDILRSRQQETHNFNGQPLNLTYYEDLGFFEYYDNGTKAAGIFGDIWTTLSEFLNFTLILSKSKEPYVGITHKNGTYSGLLEYARLNQTDVLPKMAVHATRIGAMEFSPALWMNSQRIFAYGQWKRHHAWMFNQLSSDAWALIFVFIAIMSLASVMTQRILIRHRGQKIEPESFFDHFFYGFSTMCNQPSGSGNKVGSGSKILHLTIAFFAFLTLMVYNSRLIYSMAAESFEAPFNDLETLLDNTNFRVVVLEGSIAHMCFISEFVLPIFSRIKRSQRLTVVTSLNDLYEKVCGNSSKYVLLDSVDAVAAREARYCKVKPVGMAYYLTPIASGISRRVKNRRSLDIGTMKLREYGLVDAIINRYMAWTSRNPMIRQADSLTIEIDHVSMIIGILFIGIVASIIICVVENIIFTSKKRNTVQCLTQRFSAIGQPIFARSILPTHGRNRGYIRKKKKLNIQLHG